ncbi:MAG: RdgB/HAM1 family non-canonical purine NTP pyrophosphatase [Chitinophagales bacterium]|nr:RdgB/HAM1 family non-canonical purine NTP pyrophosphatase [Chitinophagales bacterium]
MQLVFATNNQNKINEVKTVIDQSIDLLTLKDIGCFEELPETHFTIEENAIEKAQFVANKYNINCFAEDTGLLIDALNGDPGVFSARYAGEQRSDSDNMAKVLDLMQNETNRKAHFKTIISLILNGKIYNFEGKLEGTIASTPSGNNGFGYDPIFVLDDGRTLAMLAKHEKTKISHRGKAMMQLINFLNRL